MSLQLVSSFTSKDYPYCVTIRASTQEASLERLRMKFKRAISFSNAKDYKFFEEGDKIIVHLRTQENFEDVQHALGPDKPVIQSVQLDLPSQKPRLVKKRCKVVQESLNKLGFADKFVISPRPDLNGFSFYADGTATYFKLKDMRLETFILGVE